MFSPVHVMHIASLIDGTMCVLACVLAPFFEKIYHRTYFPRGLIYLLFLISSAPLFSCKTFCLASAPFTTSSVSSTYGCLIVKHQMSR